MSAAYTSTLVSTARTSGPSMACLLLICLDECHKGVELTVWSPTGEAPQSFSVSTGAPPGRGWDLTIPRKIEAGRFGKRITLPSRCIEEFELIARASIRGARGRPLEWSPALCWGVGIPYGGAF